MSSALIFSFYLLGFTIVYIKHKFEHHSENRRTWDRVLTSLFFASFSWLTIALFAIAYLIVTLSQIKLPKPPKWL